MNETITPPRARYSLQQIIDTIQLLTLLTGDIPKELRVSQECFNWYREQVRQVATNFHIPHDGIKDNDLSFKETKLVPILELQK